MSKTEKNGAEAKLYPDNVISLDKALQLAKIKNDQMGAGTFLHQKTIDRLNAIAPLYHQTRLNFFEKKGALRNTVAQKEKMGTDTALYVSHFLQVFNLGVMRGKYLQGGRGYYGLPVHSFALPNLKGDENIKMAARQVVEGEAARVTAGHVAVSNPSASEVEVPAVAFSSLMIEVNRAKQALADERKAIRALHKEVRAVVKKVWREVEVFYSEGGSERMRKLAREWGVHYARKGGEKTVSGTATDAASGLPLAGVQVKFKNGKNKTVTRSDGHFILKTNLLHSQTLLATLSGYSPAEIIIELIEGEESFCEVKMEKEAIDN